MKLGDLLLLKGYINKKQLQEALGKQAENAIIYDKSQPLGKVLIDEGYVTREDVAEALNDQKHTFEVEEEKVMPTEIGENSKFTFDLKFMATIGAVIVSACATYFTITGQINELASKDSPSRLEYTMLSNEINDIKNAGNLDIITYKLEQYDETFRDLKELANELKPLKSDLEYIKKEIKALKNIDPIEIPEVDLSSLEQSIKNLGISINSIETKINDYEKRLKKVEESGGGRF